MSEQIKVGQSVKGEIIAIENEIANTDSKIAESIKDSPEITKLVSKIDIGETDSIINYGSQAASEISSFADKVLAQMQIAKIEESSKLIKNLGDIMDEFDIKDFEDEKQNVFQKLFSSAKDRIEKLFVKYQTMGGKVDKIYQELKVYENQIHESNNVLEEMFDTNMDYYEELQKHIVAGKLAEENINENVIAQLQAKADESGEQIDQIKVNNARQGLELLNQRIYDLEMAKNVALQSLPQIKLIQRGNFDLLRKINSAFIVTLPIFKQGLTQAIALKRQKIQAEAMSELDKRTNELLLKNAQNTAEQSKLTAELATGSSIQIETLQESWQIIMTGITETKAIQEDAIAKRKEGTKQLEVLQGEYRKELNKLN